MNKPLIVIRKEGRQDSSGKTWFFEYWTNDIICPERPTPVCVQGFRCNLQSHINLLHERGYAVRISRKSHDAIIKELTPKLLVYSDDWAGPR